MTAAEYAGGTNVVSAGAKQIADVIGYAFVPSGDTCNSVATYSDPLLSNDSTITGNGSLKCVPSC